MYYNIGDIITPSINQFKDVAIGLIVDIKDNTYLVKWIITDKVKNKIVEMWNEDNLVNVLDYIKENEYSRLKKREMEKMKKL